MILEDATKEAYGYSLRDLKPKSDKPILAACELCGKFRVLQMHGYRTFCGSCSHLFSEGHKGENNPNFGNRGAESFNYKGGKVKHNCPVCGGQFKVRPLDIKNGKGIYCSCSCRGKAHKGKKHPNYGKRGKNANGYKGGNKVVQARTHAKRKRNLGYTLLIPLKPGEVGHHVTNEYVIGIPKDTHQGFSGYERKTHRTKVLLWVKANDKKKYLIMLNVLAKEPLK